MKRIFSLLGLVVAVAMCHAQSVSSPYNLDFETVDSNNMLPTGWQFFYDSSVTPLRVDDKVVQHGRYSFFIDGTNPRHEWATSKYVIKSAFAGKKIKLSGYLKTENVAGAGLWMRIDGNVDKLEFDNMSDRLVKGSTDWQEYTIELKYDDKKARRILIGARVYGNGKIWMDNLHITIDGKDITEAATYTPEPETRADADTQFAEASGINQIATDADNVSRLTQLGMVWAFIKYYHPQIAAGNFNMDAELFRVLPKILSAGNSKDAAGEISKWIDLFGMPEVCAQCDTLLPSDDIKLMPDFSFLLNKNKMPGDIVDKLQYIRKNRRDYSKHHYVGAASASNPLFKNENRFAGNDFPDAGVRLLALYRYWAMIQYFFPDRHLIGEDWNKVLSEFIPEFCGAKDALAYQLACLRLIARINDTHAGMTSYEIEKMKGRNILPFKADFIEDKMVVTKIYDDNIKDQVKPGDIIEKIGETTVKELVAKYRPLTPASNYETQLRDLCGLGGFLMRTPELKLSFTIRRNRDVAVLNLSTIPLAAEAAEKIYGDEPDSSHKMLADNIGYIYPAKLSEDDFSRIKNRFADAIGIVIDMRCYPSDFMVYNYGNWLKSKQSVCIQHTACNIFYPGAFGKSSTRSNGMGIGRHFVGKVVIIVNAQTQSSAEYQTMALRSGNNVTVIGSTTAGADGDVSSLVLPGGLATRFSGIGVLYPDGTETQRVGIKIDKVVKPTIKGIREGRDELMEEALRIIKG